MRGTMDCTKLDHTSCWKGWALKSWPLTCKTKKKHDHERILNKNKENSVAAKIKQAHLFFFL